MAEEEKNESADSSQQPADDGPEAEETPDVEETPDADAEQAPAEAEAPAKAAPATEGGSDDDEEGPPGPKQLRKLARSQFTGPAKPPRSPEERAAERLERRKLAAAERSRYRKRRRTKKGEPGVGTPPAERVPVARKVRQGLVVSSKADKTITVRIDVARRHPAYEKVVRRSSTLHVHDESNSAGEGDVVRVVETRPMSRRKRWRLLNVVEKAK